MACSWFPMDIVVALENEDEWVAQYGAEFTARVRAMPWRNIRIQDHYYYVIEAELLVENGSDARTQMTRSVEECFPDGGQGVTWVGQDRWWR